MILNDIDGCLDASQLIQAFVNLIPVEAAHPFQNPWHQSSFTHMKVLADEAASIRWGFSLFNLGCDSSCDKQSLQDKPLAAMVAAEPTKGTNSTSSSTRHRGFPFSISSPWFN